MRIREWPGAVGGAGTKLRSHTSEWTGSSKIQPRRGGRVRARHGPMPMKRPTTEAISPFFIVSNVDQTIAFYCEKLGFETRFQEPDRNPFFAIIGRDGAQLFVKSDKAVSPLPNPKRHPSMRWDAYVCSPDPDALAAEFADHGAAFSAPLKDTPDGLRGFEIRDPDGYVLFFGRPR